MKILELATAPEGVLRRRLRRLEQTAYESQR